MTESKARIAGFFYLLVFITGGIGLALAGKYVVPGDAAATARNILANETSFRIGWAINLLATVCYVVVTALFYEIFKAASRSLSLSAAFLSLTGCVIGALSSLFQIAPVLILKNAKAFSAFGSEEVQTLALLFARMAAQCNALSLVFFGFYCLSIGTLILKSTFLPRILGFGMLFASIGWLTFLWGPLVQAIYPFNLLPGVIGELALTLWLLTRGISVPRWQEQAAT